LHILKGYRSRRLLAEFPISRKKEDSTHYWRIFEKQETGPKVMAVASTSAESDGNTQPNVFKI